MQELLQTAGESLLDLFGTEALFASREGDALEKVKISPFFRIRKGEGDKKGERLSETGDLLMEGNILSSALIPGKSFLRIGEQCWTVTAFTVMGSALYELEIRR